MPRPTIAFALGDLVSGYLLSSPYICRSCRHLALRQPLARPQSLRHASSEQIPFTERARRKIWATDTTPGLEDPYDGESFLERRRKERTHAKEAQELKALEEEHATERVGPSSTGSPAIDEDADSPFVSKDYVPAETWDGLEHVGHKGHWRDIPPKPEDDFHTFIDTRGLDPSHPDHFRAAIHQATVEVITLQQADKDLTLSTLATSWYPEIQELMARTKVEIPLGNRRPKLTYPTEKTKGIIIGWFLKAHREKLRKEAESIGAAAEAVNDTSSIAEPDVEETDEASDTLEEDEIMTTTAGTADDVYDAAEVEQSIFASDEKLAERQRREFDVQYGRNLESRRTVQRMLFYEGVEAPAFGASQSYLDVKLNFKDELTYFLFRRITQLTGLRIPDPVLAKAKTLRSIYIYQLQQALQPKPKNLAETLAMKPELTSLPNVTIMARRETPVDKEKALGRWKVIEAELRSRGLPVLGRADA